MNRATLLLLAVLSLAGRSAAEEAGLPEEVKAGISLPELSAAIPLRDDVDVLDVAIITRDGRRLPFTNGKVRPGPELVEELARFAKDVREDESGEARPKAVVLHADESTPWLPVGDVLRACADPTVRLREVFWAVRSPKGPGVIPVFLPTEAASPNPRPETEPVLQVILARPDGEDETRFRIMDRWLAWGQRGLDALAFHMLRTGAEFSGIPCRMTVDPAVPYSEVAEIVAVAAAANLGPIQFVDQAKETRIVWQVPDPVREGVDLAPARNAVAPGENSRLEILYLPDAGRIYADGGLRTLEGLRDRLLLRSRDRRDGDHPERVSDLPVTVLAPADTRWREVQWMLQACADPEVRIHDVSLGVRGGGRIPVNFPTAEPAEGIAWLTIRIQADPKNEVPLKVLLRDEVLGEGEDGVMVLAGTLTSIREKYPDKTIHAAIGAWADVEVRVVVRVLDILRGIDVTNFRFLLD